MPRRPGPAPPPTLRPHLVHPVLEDGSQRCVGACEGLQVARRPHLAVAVEQRHPATPRAGAEVHPRPHPGDGRALGVVRAALPGVVVPLAGQRLQQPGRAAAHQVEDVLVGEGQGGPGWSPRPRHLCRSHTCRTVSVNPPPAKFLNLHLSLNRNIL